MYLAASPPQMLPTTTLNAATETSAALGGNAKRVKRGLENPMEIPMQWRTDSDALGGGKVVTHINVDRLWWIGVGMTGLGGLLYLGPRRMGMTKK